MNILAQEARKRQAVVKLARRKGKSFAARIYGVSLSSVKRWDKRYDGKDWRSLLERSHRPHSHPKQHTKEEEKIISKAFWKKYERYGWDGGVYRGKRAGIQAKLERNDLYGKTAGAGGEEEKAAAAPTRPPVSGDIGSGRKSTGRCERSTVQLPAGKSLAGRQASVSVDSDRRMHEDTVCLWV